MRNIKIRLIVADDHPMFLHGLCQAIETEPTFEVLKSCRDGDEALRAIDEHRPDIAVLDMDMPKRKGLDVVKELSRRNIDTDIIILTMYDQEDLFNMAIDLGVMGYILKDSAVADIIDCVRTVAGGAQYITPTISGYLIKRSKRIDLSSDVRSGISQLTTMQRKVLHLIAQNNTSKEIAELLFISPKTVERHRSNICDKLGITGPNALLKFVIEHKAIL
ncbi:MAG: response regulator transcription factor [Bacteroidota bacterium]|jgi:DNA-binding NarL/FixJ family response regulator